MLKKLYYNSKTTKTYIKTQIILIYIPLPCKFYNIIKAFHPEVILILKQLNLVKLYISKIIDLESFMASPPSPTGKYFIKKL